MDDPVLHNLHTMSSIRNSLVPTASLHLSFAVHSAKKAVEWNLGTWLVECTLYSLCWKQGYKGDIAGGWVIWHLLERQ